MNIDDVKRVYLETGGIFKNRAYADFYVERKHGTQRRINELVYGMIRGGDGMEAPKLVMKENEKPVITGNKTLELPTDKINFTALADIVILSQVREWSFGSVTQEILDSLPESLHDKIHEVCDEMYANQNPLPKSGGGN
jgi:hypothetical protein